MGKHYVCQTRQNSWELHLDSKAAYPQNRYPLSALDLWHKWFLPSPVTHILGKGFVSIASNTLFVPFLARHLLHMLLLCMLHLPLHDTVLSPSLSSLYFFYRKEPGTIFFTTYVTTQTHFPLGSGVFISQSRPSVLAYLISPQSTLLPKSILCNLTESLCYKVINNF